MLTFNHLLQSAGMELSSVRLVRHQDNRKSQGERKSLYNLWTAHDGRFDLYQELQGADNPFPVGGFLASFVVTPSRETLFVGIYKVNGKGPFKGEIICPLKGNICKSPGHLRFDLELCSLLREYEGRVVIDWGPGARSWIQRPVNKAKPILELRATIQEPYFPGFTDFKWELNELDSLPPSWKEVLKATGGVYLLTCLQTGELYVGSASGQEGFLSRFHSYAADNHGGNSLLKKRRPKPYQISILELASSAATKEEIIRREGIWKGKLGSRAFGLNLN